MKTKNLIPYVIMMIFISEISLAQITFQKTIGSPFYEFFSFCFQTADSCSVFGGTSWVPSDGLLVKTDFNGNVLWNKTYDIYSVDGFSCGLQTSDNGYLLAGLSSLYTEGLIVKTDTAGNLVWSKSYVEGYDFNIQSIAQTPDGGYVCIANTDSDGFAYFDAFLFKIDSSGNFLWCKSYSGNRDVIFNSVQVTSDKGFIMVGGDDSLGWADQDILLVKTDSLGNLLWSKSYGGTAVDRGWGIYQTTDHGYLIAGTTSSFGSTLGGAYIIKTDSSGNILWSKTYTVPNTESVITSIKPTADGNFILTGIAGTGNSITHDVFTAKIDTAGNLLWSYSFGGGFEEYSGCIQECYDGGFIIAGGTKSFGAGDMDGLIIKTDSTGTDSCNFTVLPFNVNVVSTQTTNPPIVQTPMNLTVFNNVININSFGSVTSICSSTGVSTYENDKRPLISISPNPFSFSSTLTISGNVSLTDLTLSVFNIDGRTVRAFPVTSHQTIIERNELAAGIYFYKLTSGLSAKAFGKLIIQ